MKHSKKPSKKEIMKMHSKKMPGMKMNKEHYKMMENMMMKMNGKGKNGY